MGAHGTLDQALAGVAAFAGASPDEEARQLRRERGKDRKKARKHKRRAGSKDAEGDTGSRKRSRDRDRAPNGKARRGKAKRRKKGEEASSEASGSSSSGAEAGSLQEQLARGRAAARLVRELLAARPELKRDLREARPCLLHCHSVAVAGLLIGYVDWFKAHDRAVYLTVHAVVQHQWGATHVYCLLCGSCCGGWTPARRCRSPASRTWRCGRSWRSCLCTCACARRCRRAGQRSRGPLHPQPQPAPPLEVSRLRTACLRHTHVVLLPVVLAL